MEALTVILSHLLIATLLRHWRLQPKSDGRIDPRTHKSFPAHASKHLLTVCRYVERNPVRAGLVEHTERWRWSSARIRANSEIDTNKTALTPLAFDATFDWREFASGKLGATICSARLQLILQPKKERVVRLRPQNLVNRSSVQNLALVRPRSSDTDASNLDPHQVRQAETRRQVAELKVAALPPETYQWLLVPTQATPQSAVTWEQTRSGVQHVAVKEVGEDFASHFYLPRLRGAKVSGGPKRSRTSYRSRRHRNCVHPVARNGDRRFRLTTPLQLRTAPP